MSRLPRLGALSVAAALAWALLVALAAVGQPAATNDEEAQTLWKQIHGLQELKRLGVTAEQRLALSQIVAAYQRDRDALTTPADPEALRQALLVVRDTLLSNEEPTPEMWEAVQTARGGEPDQEQAAQERRKQAVADLAAVLTDEQRVGLALPPIEEMAQNILRALGQTRQLPEAQRAEARGQMIEQVAMGLSMMTGAADAETVRGLLHTWEGRIDALPPGPQGNVGEQLLAEFVGQLKPLVTPDEQQVRERTNARLGQMLDEPFSVQLLEDSARAMGAQ